MSEVQKHTQEDTWRHVPGILNLMGIPTRGLDATEFVQSELWFNGPYFIRKPKEFWLVDISKDMKEPPPEALVEEKSIATQHTLLTTEKVPTVNLENVIDSKRFHSFDELLRVTVYVICFIAKLCGKLQRDVLAFPESLNVETEEIVNAERLWVKSLQNIFHDDPSYDQLKNQLGIVLTEEGILLCRGGLQHSKLPYSQKFPALLPSDSYVTELIIQQCHEHVFHNKTRETFNELRERYWIPRDRQKVRKIINKCVTCRRFERQPYVTPAMAPLPEFRLYSEVPAFQMVNWPRLLWASLSEEYIRERCHQGMEMSV